MSSKAFNIVLPEELVKQADALAKKEFRNRSELIREALRVYVAKKRSWDELSEYGRHQAKAVGITSEEQVDDIVNEYRRNQKSSRRP